MTIRKLSLAVLTATMALSSTQSAALGLGALEVKSNLDQPLDGVIELRVAAGDDMQTVQASIASEEDFQRLAVDYPEYLKDITLTVEDIPGQGYVLRVASNDVVIKEPFIHFLVRVDWSGGSFLREYTALIDPPVYAAESPQAVAEPKVVGSDLAYKTPAQEQTSSYAEPAELAPVEEVLTQVQEPQAEVESESITSEVAATQNPTTQSSASQAQFVGDSTDARYGPVVRGESLSVIAEELQKQFPDLSIYQIMKVLFEENRSSFINDNINGLLAGSVLNIGDLNAIRQVDIADAKQFFYEQINEWDPTTLVAAGTDEIRVGQDEYTGSDYTSDTSSSNDFGSSGEAFQVGASSEVDSYVSQGDSSSSQAEVLALRQQISELETTIASKDLENQELTERISLLEGQLADMNRLLSMDVEDADLAAVQAALAEQNAAPEVDQTSVDELVDSIATDVSESSETGAGFIDPLATIDDEFAEQDEAIAELVDEQAGDVVLDETLQDESPEELGENQVAQQQATPKPVSQPQSKSFFSGLQESVFDGGLWKLIAAGGAVLFGGLGLWVLRRRRADQEFEVSMMSIESQSQSVAHEKTVTVSEDGEENTKNSGDTSFLTVYSDSDAVVQADEVDPVAEADVYIAYGRDEQAEEVLLDGIASKPSRVDIKQKLLSLYHKNSNVEGFERIAEELYSQKDFLTKNVWQEVSLMGKDLAPENPLFDIAATDGIEGEEDSSNMITSGDTAEQDAVDSMVGSDAAAIQFAEDDASISLVNFDDGQSQVSELDEVALDALNLNDGESEANNADDASGADVLAQDADDVDDADDEEDADSVFEIDFGDEADADLQSPVVEAQDQSDSDDEQDEVAIADPEFMDSHNSESIDLDSDLEAVSFDEDEHSDISIEQISDVSDLDIDDDYDEARTQYELAKVFVDLGDQDGARKILDDIVANAGNTKEVIDDAEKLLQSINT